MLGLHPHVANNINLNSFTTPSLISFSFVNQVPLILTRAIIFLILWALTILWKNLVFLSPSFSHTSLDFCFHEICVRRTHFLKSSCAPLLAYSWTTSGQTTFTLSQSSTWFKANALLTSTLPKTFLFQSLSNDFKAFSFTAKTKLVDPLKLRPSH